MDLKHTRNNLSQYGRSRDARGEGGWDSPSLMEAWLKSSCCLRGEVVIIAFLCKNNNCNVQAKQGSGVRLLVVRSVSKKNLCRRRRKLPEKSWVCQLVLAQNSRYDQKRKASDSSCKGEKRREGGTELAEKDGLKIISLSTRILFTGNTHGERNGERRDA